MERRLSIVYLLRPAHDQVFLSYLFSVIFFQSLISPSLGSRSAQRVFEEITEFN